MKKGTQVYLTGYNTRAESVTVIKNCADAAKE